METMLAGSAVESIGDEVLVPLTFTRDMLLKPLQQAVGVVERKQVNPILGNLLFWLENKTLSLIGTDGDLEIQTRFPFLDFDFKVLFTIPARKTLDIVKALPDGAWLQFIMDGNQVKLVSGKSRFSLHRLPAEQFPVRAHFEPNHVCVLNQKTFKQALSRVAFAMAAQDMRFALNSTLVQFMPDGDLICVASDGHRLAKSLFSNAFDDSLFVEPVQIILPRKTIHELSRLLEDSDEDIQIQTSARLIRFVTSEWSLSSKCLEGPYPDYQRVLLHANYNQVELNRSDFLQAIARISILSNDLNRGVALVVDGQIMTLTSHNQEKEEAQEQIDLISVSENLNVCFNAAYLKEILMAIESETILLKVSKSGTSAMIEPSHSTTDAYVIMPITF